MMFDRERRGARPRLPAVAVVLLAAMMAMVTSPPAFGMLQGADAASTDGIARVRHGVRPGELLLERRVVNVTSELAAEKAGTSPVATTPTSAGALSALLTTESASKGTSGGAFSRTTTRTTTTRRARGLTPARSAPTHPASPSRSSSSPPTEGAGCGSR